MTSRLWRTISMLATIPVFLFFVLILFLFSPTWAFLPLLLLIVISTFIIYIIKVVWPMPRPDATRLLKLRSSSLRDVWDYVDQGSFPSAHAARAAGLVTIACFSSSWWLCLAALCFFFLVSYSRVALKRHYWRDIIGGMVIGVMVGVAAWLLSPLVQWWFLPQGYYMVWHPV